jgi:hypothetical protein
MLSVIRSINGTHRVLTVNTWVHDGSEREEEETGKRRKGRQTDIDNVKKKPTVTENGMKKIIKRKYLPYYLSEIAVPF